MVYNFDQHANERGWASIPNVHSERVHLVPLSKISDEREGCMVERVKDRGNWCADCLALTSTPSCAADFWPEEVAHASETAFSLRRPNWNTLRVVHHPRDGHAYLDAAWRKQLLHRRHASPRWGWTPTPGWSTALAETPVLPTAHRRGWHRRQDYETLQFLSGNHGYHKDPMPLYHSFQNTTA